MANSFIGIKVREDVPRDGKWSKGDFVINNNPDNLFNISGWVCEKSGEPGIWRALTNNGVLVCSRLLIDDSIKVLVELVSKGKFVNNHFEVYAITEIMGYKFKVMIYQGPVEINEALKDFNSICENMIEQRKFDLKNRRVNK